jgi:hypothetical protein
MLQQDPLATSRVCGRSPWRGSRIEYNERLPSVEAGAYLVTWTKAKKKGRADDPFAIKRAVLIFPVVLVALGVLDVQPA